VTNPLESTTPSGGDPAVDAYDRITDPIFALDREWRFTFLNEQAEQVLQRDEEHALGTAVWEVFPDGDDAAFRSEFERAVRTQQGVTFEAYYDPLDIWFEVRAYPSDTGLSVSLHDVTDRVGRDETLQDREQTLREVYEIIADPDRSFDDRVTALLHVVRTTIGTEYATLSRIDQDADEYVFEAVAAPEGADLEAGDVTLLRGPETGVAEAYPELADEPFAPDEPDEPEIDDLERAVDSIVLMKNLSELAVDLAYGSILFDNAELAEEVRNLEIEVDSLQSRFEAWTLRAAREAEDPVSLRGLIHLGVATEEISDAAVKITEGVTHDLGVHRVVEMAVQESDEIITRIVIREGSDLAGTSVRNGVPTTDVSTSVIAIRRPDDGWLIGHDIDTVLQPGDAVISKGTRTSAEEFEALAS
jgi:uncharacterized protein with PhoU and TrkA domain